MEDFSHKMACKSILFSNILEDTLPKALSQEEAEALVVKLYDNGKIGKIEASIKQLEQHVKAFKLLCSEAYPLELTEEVIKSAHGTMMYGLKNEQGYAVSAGIYRTISVHAGSIFTGYHHYPPSETIPENMTRIVSEYEEKMKGDHDPYAMASWLYFKVVTLHPFDDGNGRLSRLLWCYSLIRDGLPFPVWLTSGHKKAQKHLLHCLKKDTISSKPSYITALTLVSISKGWESFQQQAVLA